MLILRTLTIERMHGYTIAQHIARVSNNALVVEKGRFTLLWSACNARAG